MYKKCRSSPARRSHLHSNSFSVQRSPCGQRSRLRFPGRAERWPRLLLPTASGQPVQTNRGAYGGPALSPCPALPLPCPGAGAAPAGPGGGRACPGPGPLLPGAPSPGGSARGSGRAGPRQSYRQLPSRPAEIFIIFFGSFFSSPRAVRELPTRSWPGAEPAPPGRAERR